MKKKIVEYTKYCPKCKYEDLEAEKDPCNTCLSTPAAEDSHKPVEFIPKNKTDNE